MRTVDEQQIRYKAYELWLARGCATGNALQDWLDAERELLKPHPKYGLREIRLKYGLKEFTGERGEA